MFTELLAPAKDKETAFAAIDCGADAVYMGASAFGARRNAQNSLEDIREVVNYAHKFWAKVFITVNTILKDDEIEDAFRLVKELDKIGVDAVIIQDMGLLKKMIDAGLSIPAHMSTQCDNRTLEKASFFNKIGVSRVVLARELNLEKIKEIHEANPDLELEAFVHGALCVSYSGQCYLSNYIGGRSANRGECAQPCRKKYTVKTQDGRILAKDIHALCLKDFNASKHLKKMIENGIFSFKIEGRLKDCGYVKNITAFYRKELDKYSKKTSSGKSVYPFAPNPEKSFNRGFTDYFLEGRKECYNFISPKSQGEFIGKVKEVQKNYIVIDTKKSLHPQDGLMFQDKGFLVNKVEGNKVYPNKFIDIKPGVEIYRNSDIEFEKELSRPVKRQIGVKAEISSGQLRLKDEDGISYAVSLPAGEKANNPDKIKEIFIKQFSKTGEGDFYIFDIKIVQELPFMPVSAINALRRDSFESLMQERLKAYKKQIQKKMNYAAYFQKEIDYRGNVSNKEARAFYMQCGCEVTEPAPEIIQPKHQYELMRTKHCIKYALGICKSSEKLVLEDETGKEYPLQFDCKNCEMAILTHNFLE